LFTVITISAAEGLAGRRLDRRRRYAHNGRELVEAASWSQPCSGCVVLGCTDTGLGCAECGYTGRRRIHVWVPISIQRAHRAAARRKRARKVAVS
jgi:hypothetical protein